MLLLANGLSSMRQAQSSFQSYFKPAVAFAGNTGCLSTICHPDLSHGSDLMGTALLQIAKGRNAQAGW